MPIFYILSQTFRPTNDFLMYGEGPLAQEDRHFLAVLVCFLKNLSLIMHLYDLFRLHLAMSASIWFPFMLSRSFAKAETQLFEL